MAGIERPEQLVEGFVAAWNAGDATALANLFAEDADFVNVVGLWWRDRRRIEQAHAYGFVRIFPGSVMRLLEVKVRPVGASAAVVHARWELRGQRTPDGATDQPRRGVLVVVAERENGAWTAVAAQNTDRIPGSETWLNEAGGARALSYRSGARDW